jgi:hypothetical protein
MDVLDRDIGAFFETKHASADAGTAADGSHDNTKLTGETIDLNGQYSSGKLVIAWEATLDTDETLSLTVEHQDSADGSSWDAAVADLAKTVVKTAGSAATFYGTREIDVKLDGSKKYTRYNITADLSRGGIDTYKTQAALFVPKVNPS